jgi:hypothetical protein
VFTVTGSSLTVMDNVLGSIPRENGEKSEKRRKREEKSRAVAVVLAFCNCGPSLNSVRPVLVDLSVFRPQKSQKRSGSRNILEDDEPRGSCFTLSRPLPPMPRLSSSSDDEEKVKPSHRRPHRKSQPHSSSRPRTSSLALVLTSVAAVGLWKYSDALGLSLSRSSGSTGGLVSAKDLDAVSAIAWEDVVDRCEDLHTLPGVPRDFHERTVSDRFVPVRLFLLFRSLLPFDTHYSLY